jgi:hypothetical protein
MRQAPRWKLAAVSPAKPALRISTRGRLAFSEGHSLGGSMRKSLGAGMSISVVLAAEYDRFHQSVERNRTRPAG